MKGIIAVAIELKKARWFSRYKKTDYHCFSCSCIIACSLQANLLAQWGKNVPQDAELTLELMLRYPKKIKAIEPDNADIRLLQQLVEQRR